MPFSRLAACGGQCVLSTGGGTLFAFYSVVVRTGDMSVQVCDQKGAYQRPGQDIENSCKPECQRKPKNLKDNY